MSLIKSLIEKLPLTLRFKVVRNHVKLPQTIPEGFTFEVASSRADLEEAFVVLQESYLSAGYSKPNLSGLRVTKYHALPTTSVLVVKHFGKIIGTLSLIVDASLGLPLAEAMDLTDIRKKYARVAEVSSLALKKEYRAKNNGEIFWLLLQYMHSYAMDVLNLDAYVIGTHPKWHDFYVGILGLKQLSNGTVQSEYRFANNNPLTAFTLDIRSHRQEMKAIYQNKPRIKNIFSYFYENAFFNFENVEQIRALEGPQMNHADLNYFLKEQSLVWSDLSSKDKSVINFLYLENSHRDTRFSVALNASDAWQTGQSFRVKDLSRSGLRVQGYVPSNKINQIRINVDSLHSIHLKVRVVWQDQINQVGLEIIEENKNWNNLIQYLQFATNRTQQAVG